MYRNALRVIELRPFGLVGYLNINGGMRFDTTQDSVRDKAQLSTKKFNDVPNVQSRFIIV